MKFIKEKKVNNYLMIALLYLSFCACFWYGSRGTVAYTSLSMAGMGMVSFMFNDIVAFLFAGVIPTLLFEIINSFVFKMAQVKIGGGADDMRYALRFFYIPANLVAFGLKFLYFMSPLIMPYGNIIIDFVIAALFFVAYMFYVAKNHVDKTKWGAMIYQLGGAFLIVYAFLTVFNIITGVIL